MVQGSELLTVPKAAKELGKGKKTLYRWIESGQVIAITLGGILFIPTSEIDRIKNLEAVDPGKSTA